MLIPNPGRDIFSALNPGAIVKLRGLLLSKDRAIVDCWSAATRHTAIDLDVADDRDVLEWLNGEKYEAVIVDAREESRRALIDKVRRAPSSNTAVIVAISEAKALGALLQSGASIALPFPVANDVAIRCLRAVYPLMRRDRRRYVRFPINEDCKITVDGETRAAKVLNVSESGLGLSQISLRTNAHIKVSYSLPHGSPIACAGCVVWSKDSGQAGVRITEISEASRLALNHWLDLKLEAELQTAEILARRPPVFS